MMKTVYLAQLAMSHMRCRIPGRRCYSNKLALIFWATVCRRGLKIMGFPSSGVVAGLLGVYPPRSSSLCDLSSSEPASSPKLNS